ncbi:MAG: RHS repeat-associated core domain-containing protein [Candidatus Omnitrophota bacterium]
MKKILFKSMSAVLAVTCFLSFTFNGLTIAKAGESSASIAASGAITPGGATSINFSMNSFQTDLFRGNASYSVPIAVPGGRKGISPQLGLSYSSQPANSWCGVGWSLELGAITRSMKNGYPKYDSTDIFSYNGAELVNTTGNEYRLKTDNAFMRFFNNGSTWEVLDTKGTKYNFTSTITTPLGIYQWSLTRVTDLSGNYMSVTYITDQNQVYPQQIQYTGNDNTSAVPYYTVDFVLENRTDTITQNLIMPIANTSGPATIFKTVTAKRLKTIEVKYSGSLIRKYILNYHDSAVTKRSMLESITLYGEDGITALNPITFTYDETVPSINASTGVNLNTVQGSPLMGDFNGDGINDICVALYEDFGVYLGNADGTFQSRSIWGHYPGSDAGASFFSTGDFNGDGYTDIFNLLAWGNGWENYGLIVYLSDNGTGFKNEAYWYRDTRSFSTQRQPLVFSTDVNKDGKTDILVLDKYSGIYNPPQSNVPDIKGKFYVANDNANGFNISDLESNLFVGEYGNFMTTIGDVNGDGELDMVFGCHGANLVKVALYPDYISGNIISPYVWLSGHLIDSNIITTDVNYDGKSDFLRFYSPQGNWDCFLSNGANFESNYQTWCSSFGGTRCPIAGNFGTSSVTVPGTFYNNTHNGTAEWQIAQATSANARADYLLSVDNGVSGSLDINYTQYQEDTLPFIHYVVESITQNDGRGNSYTSRYEYSGAQYDRQDREFRGFNCVKVLDADGNYSLNYFHQDDILKGKTYLSETRDAAGNLYAKSENIWASTQPFTGVYNIFVTQQNNYSYETQATPKHTRMNYDYDSYGNCTYVGCEGYLDISGDEKTVHTQYYAPAANITCLPSHTWTQNSSGYKTSEQWFEYDGGTSLSHGLLTKQTSWLEGGTNPDVEYTYDDYGQVIEVKDALSRTTTTEYDSAQHLFPIKITNAKAQEITSTYNPKTQQVLTITDANNQTTTNQYDVFGRLIKVIGPNDTAAYPSASYSYDLNANPIKVTSNTKITDSNYLTSYSFYDGMGRCIQSKSPAENSNQQVVSGAVVYDTRGLVSETYFPHFAAASANYSTPDLNQPKTTFSYDAMGRVIQTQAPDGTIYCKEYDISKITATIEYQGVELQKSVSYFDAYGQLTSKEEHNQGEIYTTTYAYDTSGNLKTLTDSQGNVTTINYDTLGRKVSMNDPDMGTWSYSYDILGNLISQTDAKNQQITFTYDELNRLYLKNYVSAGQTITYEYDSTSKDYCIGRLSSVNYPSGSTEFYYDNLGREIKSEKTVSGTTYTVERTYDALNRLDILTYPDGEKVKYNYNLSGAIESIEYDRDGDTTFTAQGTYLVDVDYNVNGQMTDVTFGNNVYTNYTYDSNTLRLSNLLTNSGAIQDLNYQFDHLGNVTNITGVANNKTVNQAFTYDGLSRLTEANSPSTYGTYQYYYDSIGNIDYKVENATTTNYTYGSSRPHAVTQFGDKTITYDANGNMLSKGDLNFDYDDENRLTQVTIDDPYPVTAEKTISLQEGWNFISFPVEFADSTITTVLSSIASDYDQVSRYNNATGEFEHFVKNPDYNDFSEFEYGRGYQIHITNAAGVNLAVSGTVPTNHEEVLNAGLNLIVNPKLATATIEDALADLKDQVHYDTVYKYNTTTDVLESVDPKTTNVNVGESLFINIKNDVTWVINKKLGTTTYTYDGDGGRTKKVVTGGLRNSSTVYIGSLYEEETVDGNTTTKNHIYFRRKKLTTKQDNGTTVKTLYFHEDHLGSSNVITDSNGQVVQHVEYEPFGKVILEEKDEELYTNYKFTGKEWDASAELYFYSARYFDPDLCKFITPDSMVPYPDDPQSFNRYSYCDNNPVNYVDPSGHFFWAAALIGAAIGGITAAATGGNVWQGMLGGFIGGAIFCGIGNMGLAGLDKIVAHTAGGMISGGVNSAISGGDIGMGIISGGLSAGVASWAGESFGELFSPIEGQIVKNGIRRTALGSLTGGVVSKTMGGDFWDGAKNGFLTSAIAYACNDVYHLFKSNNGGTPHAGAIVGKDGKYTYHSFGPDGKPRPLGPGEYTEKSFNSWEDAKAYALEQGYEEFARYDTSSSEDAAARAAARGYKGTEYNVGANNCQHMVNDMFLSVPRIPFVGRGHPKFSFNEHKRAGVADEYGKF